MKHFVVEVTYTSPIEKIDEALTEHRKFLQLGYDQGLLLASGPQNPRVGGMVIARAPELDVIQDYFTHDPFYIQKLAQYRFIEFQPVKQQPFLESWVKGE